MSKPAGSSEPSGPSLLFKPDQPFTAPHQLTAARPMRFKRALRDSIAAVARATHVAVLNDLLRHNESHYLDVPRSVLVVGELVESLCQPACCAENAHTGHGNSMSVHEHARLSSSCHTCMEKVKGPHDTVALRVLCPLVAPRGKEITKRLPGTQEV
eukprot:6187631-Pleurochrysis_carterae.AAC.1